MARERLKMSSDPLANLFATEQNKYYSDSNFWS